MPRLPAFMARHPGLEFNLQTSVALVDFEREPVDAALRLGSGQWTGLTAEHLFDEWIVPMASPKLIGRRRKPKPDEMGNWPLIGESDDDNQRWRRWFELFGGTPPRRYAASFTEAELLHRAAAEGMGIVLGRMILAKPLVDNGTSRHADRSAHAGRLQPLPGLSAALGRTRAAARVPRLAAPGDPQVPQRRTQPRPAQGAPVGQGRAL